MSAYVADSEIGLMVILLPAPLEVAGVFVLVWGDFFPARLSQPSLNSKVPEVLCASSLLLPHTYALLSHPQSQGKRFVFIFCFLTARLGLFIFPEIKISGKILR